MSTHTAAVLAAIAPKVVKPATNGEQATHPAAPAQATVQDPTALLAQMAARLQALEAELAAAKAKKGAPRKPTLKVSKSGAVSVYGLGRYPTTLYASQWAVLVELVKSGQVEAFLADPVNQAAMKANADAKAEAEATAVPATPAE
jgi:hypothetical protein